MTIKKNRRKTIRIATGIILIMIALRFAYKFTPYRIELLGHYDKVWTHRVNSLEKQEAALLFHKGIEFDLDYIEESDFLDVNHLPAPSIGLSFEKFIHHINTDKNYPYLWLDIKDLDTLNNRKIFNKIHPVLKSRNYPTDKVLVEGMQPEALQIFRDSGFRTSYYLPWDLNELPAEELEKEIVVLKGIDKAFPDTAFSTASSQYELIRKYFPEKELYLWTDGHRPLFKYFLFRKILNDSKVIALLAHYRSSKGGNR